MTNGFFEHPTLNSPYEAPRRHWELDESGQPTHRTIETRRRADFITPIPKPKKRKAREQSEIVFDEGKGLSTAEQQYDVTSIINEVRGHVDTWRNLPPSQWQVTPETARLLEHWRHHNFGAIRPFFCQIEAVETAIWLTEVAPHFKAGKRLLEHLASANRDANPEISHLALKLATVRRKVVGYRDPIVGVEEERLVEDEVDDVGNNNRRSGHRARSFGGCVGPTSRLVFGERAGGSRRLWQE